MSNSTNTTAVETTVAELALNGVQSKRLYAAKSSGRIQGPVGKLTVNSNLLSYLKSQLRKGAVSQSKARNIRNFIEKHENRISNRATVPQTDHSTGNMTTVTHRVSEPNLYDLVATVQRENRELSAKVDQLTEILTSEPRLTLTQINELFGS